MSTEVPSAGPAAAGGPGPLDLPALFAGARLMVMGGTGFLGKVFWVMLLERFPDVEHIWLVVRPRKRSDGSVRQTSEQRFWAEVATSPALEPLRERYPGAAFDAFLRAKITPIAGDATDPYCGVSEALRDELRGTLTAFVNSAGVVSFNPPLDYALNANAFGMQNLVALSKDLGAPGGPGLATLHTSTCYVAGDRTGQVDEVDPLTWPFPKADTLDPKHWDPEREIAECVDLVDNVRHRSGDAFRQSDFLDQAKRNLKAKNEPCRGTALEAEFARVKRKYEEQQLIDAGTERAKFWGWHNIYTYTKSIGEQILCGSGLPFTIVRPAVIESALEFPKVGWCEGINTSAPLIYLAMQGPIKYPSHKDTSLDVIPVDQVAAGMVLALGELLEGTHKRVYQLGSSDTGPLPITRLIELTALFKRRHFRKEAPGNPLVNWVKAKMEPVAVDVPTYFAKGPRRNARLFGDAAALVDSAGQGMLEQVLEPVVKGLSGVSKSLEMTANIQDQFVPFMATHNYRFSCANVRAAHARLPADMQRLISWAPETIDWRHYMLEIHCPGIQRNVSPEIDKKLQREKQPLRRHDTLVDFIDELAERHDRAPALLRTHPDGFTRISYRDLRGRTLAAAVRLSAMGVEKGDRVLISGNNHPDWACTWFGIVRLGAVAVPLDPALEVDKLPVILESARPAAAVLDAKALEAFGDALGSVPVLDLHRAPAMGAVGHLPDTPVAPDDLASVLYTSGTTGDPKGVMLTHDNFTAILASIGRLFPLRESDRMLSVLPLHHAFEFTCGLLLPLSMGARIIYLDEVNPDRLAYGLREGRVTCMVGVPALWQLLERRITGQVKDRGQLFELAFGAGLELNRRAGRALGLDMGKLLFGSVHSRFGGNIRILISGGAALPKQTQKLFSGLGLQLSEGYGLTEAAPVLTVSTPRPGGKPGNVGKAIPGVQIRIKDPDDKGVGEVLAKGDNVMAGYFGNDSATQQVLDADGWLHTGDMGRLDHKDRLVLVGRAKDVVVTAAGENIYLDDVEQSLGAVAYVNELALTGLPDGRGGERLGLLAVPDTERYPRIGRNVLHDKAREALAEAVQALPAVQRPAVVHLVDAHLPRTATRKVQRKQVRAVLEKITAAAAVTSRRGEGLGGPVAAAIAGVAGVAADRVTPETRLREAFGFDSLMFVELSSALEGVGTGRPDADALARCETVADITRLVGAAPVQADERDTAPPDPIVIPDMVAEPLRKRMAEVQRWFNGPVVGTRVLGRANIPQNRPTIVVCNHTSHLDMGVVKYALGPYGDRIASLAAQDYFFEGNRWKVAYFEHFTNAEPLDRKSGFRASLRQARAVIEAGKVVLIFPEGTRQTSGTLAEFKPMVGTLALATGTDILPLYLDGAYDSMPKGAWFPKKRGITVRIGPPLQIADLQRLTEGLKSSLAARKVAALAQLAVERLRDGEVLDLGREEGDPTADHSTRRETPTELAERAFRQLEGLFEPERVERPISWYFSLGTKDGPRWTVSVDKDKCTVLPGRPTAGKADCVVKTSEDLFSRLVLEAYVPQPAEFISGAIKTNDIPLLIEFSRVFKLSEVQL